MATESAFYTGPVTNGYRPVIHRFYHAPLFTCVRCDRQKAASMGLPTGWIKMRTGQEQRWVYLCTQCKKDYPHDRPHPRSQVR